MTGIILAGGNGARMGGKNKARLAIGDETFLDRKIRLLKPYCEAILVVAAAEPDTSGTGSASVGGVHDTDYRVIYDEAPGVGPLMGLYTGLKASTTENNFITTVDSPHIAGALVEYLTAYAGNDAAGFDVYIPMWRGYPEPLFGMYTKNCLPAVERVLGEKRRRIVSFYPYVAVGYLPEEDVRRLDPEGLSFINVNTEDEYRNIAGTGGQTQ